MNFLNPEEVRVALDTIPENATEGQRYRSHIHAAVEFVKAFAEGGVHRRTCRLLRIKHNPKCDCEYGAARLIAERLANGS